MNTYLVTLASRSTGEDQRILVRSATDQDMQDFVTSDEVLPTLKLTDPVVIAIHQLKITRPHRTSLLSLVRG
jgi:hypothetical protein